MTKYLLIDQQNAFPLTASKELLLIDAPLTLPTSTTVELSPEITAARLDGVRAADIPGRTGSSGHTGHTGSARDAELDPLVAQAIGLLHARENHEFPRIDPCVIGIVEHIDGGRILLGENAHRRGYFTCVAGYVGPGESAEAAWAREVGEETGRRIVGQVYAGSQPWPQSSSLMLGFYSVTADEEPVHEPDGELARMVWASREDLEGLPLAPEGSIARRLITQWADGEFTEHLEGVRRGR